MNIENLETSFDELNAVELASCQGGVAGIEGDLAVNLLDDATVGAHVNGTVDVYATTQLGDVSLNIDHPLD